MSTVPDELPALLHGAWVISQVGDKQALKMIESGALGWDRLMAHERKHWEAVARSAVEFITGEKVSAPVDFSQDFPPGVHT
jgi:hypothetical protein